MQHGRRRVLHSVVGLSSGRRRQPTTSFYGTRAHLAMVKIALQHCDFVQCRSGRRACGLLAESAEKDTAGGCIAAVSIVREVREVTSGWELREAEGLSGRQSRVLRAPACRAGVLMTLLLRRYPRYGTSV